MVLCWHSRVFAVGVHAHRAHPAFRRARHPIAQVASDRVRRRQRRGQFPGLHNLRPAALHGFRERVLDPFLRQDGVDRRRAMVRIFDSRIAWRDVGPRDSDTLVSAFVCYSSGSGMVTVGLQLDSLF